ncbi:ATPase chain B [Paenibacillus popilliae ATCC 14706]|uniref:ATPase chain B n=1 Tax=Paenibacillus popilliae ATCC 14706 TaxID=1212764 RepID=M9M7S5_PAEPP|nr:ATPase chain B [Paenibacillus popilliae ATCC 14706]
MQTITNTGFGKAALSKAHMMRLGGELISAAEIMTSGIILIKVKTMIPNAGERPGITDRTAVNAM